MKLFRVGLLLALYVSILTPAYAQNSFIGWTRNTLKQGWDKDFRTKYLNPEVALYVDHKFEDSKWAFACFGLIDKSWGEFIIGPRYHFNRYFDATLLIGVETGVVSYGYLGKEIDDCWRVAIDASFHYKKLSWYNEYEYGGDAGWDGDYWVSDLTYQLHKYITIQAKAYNRGRDDYRLGGGVKIPIPKTFLEFSPVALYNFETKDPEAEITVYFMFF